VVHVVRVIVMGAGVIGITTAWYLSEAGHQVVIIDRQPEAAMEASYANGGQISASHAEPWASPVAILKLLKWIARDDAPFRFEPRRDLQQWLWALGFLRECLPGRFERNSRALLDLALYSRQKFRELRERAGVTYDGASKGILQLFSDSREYASRVAHAAGMRRYGLKKEILDADGCRSLEPALSGSAVQIAGGIYAADDESGDAHRFSVGLRHLLQARGVEFIFDSRISGIEVRAGRVSGVRITKDDRERVLSGDAYVAALGATAGSLLRRAGISVRVYPLKGYSITLDVDPSESTAAPQISITDETHKLVVSRFAGRLRVAGYAELGAADPSVDRRRCSQIEDRVRRLFPAARFLGEAVCWAGLRPATPGNLPLIGRSVLPNLYLNTGHGTLGWTLACGSGSALADIMSGVIPAVDYRFLGSEA
jgi:D-amino-acid dehydrogenase